MSKAFSQARIALSLLVLSQLACRPTLTIGWQELALLLVLAAFVIGPLILRILRVVARSKELLDEEEAKKGKRKGK